jgi:hypothetical protein
MIFTSIASASGSNENISSSAIAKVNENLTAVVLQPNGLPYEEPAVLTEDYVTNLYKELSLSGKISYNIFKRAFYGYHKTAEKKLGVLAIIDYTKPSNVPRFFVLNFIEKKIQYETHVSHGKNSGLLIPVIFSNNRNSFQTSLGFYKTMDTYNGDFGYSLRLIGLENGFNSNVLERKIVIHGADYVDQSFIASHGFLGRTNGCPALPYSISTEIINYLKNGSVMYVIGNDNKYEQRSKYVTF